MIENKENLNNINLKLNFTKIEKTPSNIYNRNEFKSFLNITKKGSRNNEYKNSKKIFNSFDADAIEQIKECNNNSFKNLNNIGHLENLITESDEDLDIELKSISKIIPINKYINIDEIDINNIQDEYINKDKDLIAQKKSKIKRNPSMNSFFNDIQNDIQNNLNNNNITNNNIINKNISFIPINSEFNMTNFGLMNRPYIHSNLNEDEINITNNNIIKKINNNTITNNKKEYSIKRHNSVINNNSNKILNNINDNTYNNISNITNNNISQITNNNISNITNNNINNETNDNINSNKNNQNLYDEIQKLKKENKRLVLKNNELSFKIKTQEVKAKINNNNNNYNNNQKKFSSQREEFLLQKIKKLENELIKQKDLITKLTYNKRFNIGIRKIRVNSILIKGNDNKLKRKNSVSNFKLNMLYCNNAFKKNSYTSNLNNTLPNNNKYNNKYNKKKSKNNSIKSTSEREELSLNVKPLCSSSSSSSKILLTKNKYTKKDSKNNKDNNHKNMNKTMSIHNKNNSINLKLENIEITKNYRKIMIEKIKDFKGKNRIDDFKNDDKKNISIDYNYNINSYKNKKIAQNKTYGKTSLIMSVINDNLLGNFNLSQYMNVNNNLNNNINIQKKINLKRNSIH